MVTTNFPNGISSFGMPLVGSNIPISDTYFFVCSVNGSNSYDGSQENPYATIDYAVGKCTAAKGHVIVVLPGHIETVTAAAGLDLDISGITIVGVGRGSLRPKINFTTATTADMDVDAANITMVNFLFTGGVDALAGPIDVNAAHFSLINCETRDVTGQATDWIVCDANADNLLISGWKHQGAAAAGADTAITLVGGDDAVIEDFEIYGNFAVAAIENVTTASVRTRIGGGLRQSYIWTENVADVAITMVSTSTGFVGPNINIMLKDNAANITEAVVGAAMQFMQPINICNLAGESSMQSNITASTDA